MSGGTVLIAPPGTDLANLGGFVEVGHTDSDGITHQLDELQCWPLDAAPWAGRTVTLAMPPGALAGLRTLLGRRLRKRHLRTRREILRAAHHEYRRRIKARRR